MDPEPPVSITESTKGCPLCGALIADDGHQRHQAWHEFLESDITALNAYVATLELPPA